MKIFRPRKKVSVVVKAFVIAGLLTGLIAGIINFYRLGGWSGDQWLNYAGAMVMSLLISWLLLREAERQTRCEISESGFSIERWKLKARLPFIEATTENFLWADVKNVDRSGYMLFLTTSNGKRHVNLYLFDAPDEAGLYAFNQWTEAVKNRKNK